MVLQRFLFREEKFFQEKEKVSAFLANSTSVIRKKECQKTFGEGPRSVCNTIHAFDITNTGIGYACKCEKIFQCQWKRMKSRNFAGKEKAIVRRLTQKTYQFCNSKQTWGTLGPTNHQQKLTSLPGDKNWKRTKQNVGNEAVAPLENSTKSVKSLQLLLSSIFSWLWQSRGSNAQANIQSINITLKVYKRKTFRKHGFNGEAVWSFRPKK